MSFLPPSLFTTSPLFPLVWLALPSFYLGCLAVRAVEGDRQRFNLKEARSTLLNSIILGCLWTSGFVMQFLMDDEKTSMSPEEFAYKTVLVVAIMDLSFYWIHRALHEIPALRRFHKIHHALRASHTCWGGLDEDFEETFVIFLYLNAPFLFVSVTREFYLFYVLAGSFQTALMHSTSLSFPPAPFVNGVFHHKHHMYESKNFGGALVFWDKAFGTEKKDSKSRDSSSRES